MTKRISLILFLVLPMLAISQSEKADDPWQALRFLEGSWEGKGEGMSGYSNVIQEYEFVLDGNFLRMKTRSIFEPQDKNPNGEIHEDMGFFSYDTSQNKFVLRAFYIEGFVNTYLLTDVSEDGKVMTFETESVENAPPGTRARLVVKRTGETTMEQSFFVAFPGQEFGCFSTNRMEKK